MQLSCYFCVTYQVAFNEAVVSGIFFGCLFFALFLCLYICFDDYNVVIDYYLNQGADAYHYGEVVFKK